MKGEVFFCRGSDCPGKRPTRHVGSPSPFEAQKSRPGLSIPLRLSSSSTIASSRSLRAHLREWISTQASQDAADRFSPWIERALRDLGYDLRVPASEEKAGAVKAELRATGITTSRMQRALKEARRAAEKGQSTLGWIRSTWARAHSEELAEKALALTRSRLEKKQDAETAGLQAPPTPEEAFAFLLLWEELGGTAGVAAFRELQRRDRGELPSN